MPSFLSIRWVLDRAMWLLNYLAISHQCCQIVPSSKCQFKGSQVQKWSNLQDWFIFDLYCICMKMALCFKKGVILDFSLKNELIHKCLSCEVQNWCNHKIEMILNFTPIWQNGAKLDIGAILAIVNFVTCDSWLVNILKFGTFL